VRVRAGAEGSGTDVVIINGVRVPTTTKWPNPEDFSHRIQEAIRAVIDQLAVRSSTFDVAAADTHNKIQFQNKHFHAGRMDAPPLSLISSRSSTVKLPSRSRQKNCAVGRASK